MAARRRISSCYLTRTPDGKLLKSSSIYIRDESGRVCAIFCINFDISALAMAEQALAGLTSAHPAGEETPRITHNVNDLLDDLIRAVRPASSASRSP